MTYEEPKRICALASHVPSFIQERKFLRGVTASTLAWYESSFKAFGPVVEREYASIGAFKAAVVARIEQLHCVGRGNKAVSINTYLRCFKAFLNWCHQERILAEPIKLSWLKEEQNVLVTLNTLQIQRVLKCNPRTASGQRTHVLACVLLDTGLRITEAVSLTRSDVDFENLLLKVHGKGQKERIVPMSFELRKLLFRWVAKLPAHFEHEFSTRDGASLTTRLVLVNFKTLGKRAGIVGVRMSPHTLRHTFAVSYLRAGGNLFYLSKILGHTSITTTQRYLQSLGVEDLQAVHNKLSILSRTS